MHTTSISVEIGRFVVVLEKLISSLNHVEIVLLRRNVETCVIKMREGKSPCCLSVIAQIYKKQSHASVFDYHFADSNVAYVCWSTIESQEIRGHDIFYNVCYEYNHKSYVIVFF